jgi:hypothetical protein
MLYKEFVQRINKILPKKYKSRFGTMDIYPDNVGFETQNTGEKIFIKVRSHIITNFGWIFRGVISLFAPVIAVIGISLLEVILSLIFPSSGNKNSSELINEIFFLIPWQIYFVGFLMYYSALTTYFFINFLNWYFNIYLVTNQRIIHIEYKAFTGKNIAEAPLKNIEDISQKIIGFFPSIFNYGNVRIQTAAQRSKFYLLSVPNPSWFRDVVSDLAKLVQSNK